MWYDSALWWSYGWYIVFWIALVTLTVILTILARRNGLAVGLTLTAVYSLLFSIGVVADVYAFRWFLDELIYIIAYLDFSWQGRVPAWVETFRWWYDLWPEQLYPDWIYGR